MVLRFPKTTDRTWDSIRIFSYEECEVVEVATGSHHNIRALNKMVLNWGEQTWLSQGGQL